MVTNDKGFIPLKHRVIEGLARLAWENNVNQESTEKLDSGDFSGTEGNLPLLCI